jgi:hypothetical protein
MIENCRHHQECGNKADGQGYISKLIMVDGLCSPCRYRANGFILTALPYVVFLLLLLAVGNSGC